MSAMMEVTYCYHSGFTCAVGDVLLIFDYWRGEHDELPIDRQITPEMLRGYREKHVFISHAHPDHMDPAVFTWHEEPGLDYIVSYDMPVGTWGRRMAPGDSLRLSDRVSVRAFDSTDTGVSYLVEVDGFRVFHAGDLNFWHWREESTLQEIEEAERAFKLAVKPIIGEPIDLAMFPVDPRQGPLFDAGVNYFILTVKPKLLLPMHFWGRGEIAQEFARRARTQETVTLALTRPGERLRLERGEDGALTAHLLESAGYAAQAEMGPFDGDNPFSDTDLPVQFEL